jgi:hypothetical protein
LREKNISGGNDAEQRHEIGARQSEDGLLSFIATGGEAVIDIAAGMYAYSRPLSALNERGP